MASTDTTPLESAAVDVVIFGGGVSGLWTLDVLIRGGCRAVLLESDALGTGQTVGSQGIIHGGLKYTLAGALTRSAEAIREMPGVWREALAGKAGRPDASATRMRSEGCYLWRTGRLSSRLGMVGARVGLRVKPEHLSRGAWPAVLAKVGDVFKIEEQVISPPSFLEALAALHPGALLRYDADTLGLQRDERGHVTQITARAGDRTLRLEPGAVVLTAGLGNAALREAAGITQQRMQRRGVHMILVRETAAGATQETLPGVGVGPGVGGLPALNGHCVDGKKTRVTITSEVDPQGRTVWQVGGQVSEDGTDMDRAALLTHAVAEVSAALGGRDDLLRSERVQWATYRLDKAEVTTAGGLRPDDAFVERHGNVITCWPTKLALAPRLAEQVMELLGQDSSSAKNTDTSLFSEGLLKGWPRPRVAAAPWETAEGWTGGNLL